MRTSVALATLAIGIAGCANKPLSHDEARRLVVASSDYTLCEALMLGMDDRAIAQMAAEEQRSRGLDCSGYANAIAIRDAGRRQAAAQALGAMRPQPTYQVPMPPPVTVQRPISCTSNRIGSQTYTNCN